MTTTIDKYGRILIPKKLREALGMEEDKEYILRPEGDKLIIEPLAAEDLYVEEDGFLFFGGYEPAQDLNDWIEQERVERERTVLGL